jgi:hypothetical protein
LQASLPARGEAFSLPNGWEGCLLVPGNALLWGKGCRGFCRRHHSWTPSRKWLGTKGCLHGRAFEDAGRETLTTSLRSSVAGATLAFAMPLASLALRGFPLALSHLLWEKGCHGPGYLYPRQRLSLSSSRKWACRRLFAAGKRWPTGQQCLDQAAAR